LAHYGDNNQKKNLLTICVLTFFFFVYYIQASTFVAWTKFIFPHIYPRQLGERYFIYLNLVEFTWLIFARSRLTLKYYPKMVTLLNLAFLIYINSYAYAASL
jgi:hypothetical protein